jgi:hypothetical protein
MDWADEETMRLIPELARTNLSHKVIATALRAAERRGIESAAQLARKQYEATKHTHQQPIGVHPDAMKWLEIESILRALAPPADATGG